MSETEGRIAAGARLRAFVDTRWTRQDGGIRGLAEKLGAAPDTVYSWFRGEHPPDAFDLETLAGLLGVSRWEIVAAMDGAESVVDLKADATRSLLRELVDAALDERQVLRPGSPREGDAA